MAGIKIPFEATTPHINTIPVSEQPPYPGSRETRTPHQEPGALERDGDGGPRQPRGRRHRRSHLDLRLGGDPVRGRLQPLLPRQGRALRRRPDLLPGPRLARHLRPRLPRGSPDRGTALQLPPRAARRPRQRSLLLSPPVADARPSGSSRRCRWGSVRSWPSTRRASTTTSRTAVSTRSRTTRCGPSSATARPTSPRRSARSRWPAAKSSTISSSSSTATCSASTARCAATARSSRSSRATSAAPGGT